MDDKSSRSENYKKFLYYDDLIEDVEYKKIKDTLRKKRSRDLFYNLVIAISISISVPIVILFFVGDNKPYYGKQEIHKTITLALKNGADLRAIKQLHKTFEKTDPGFLDLLKKSQNRYNTDIPLSEILENIRTDLFITDSSLVKNNFLTKLDSLISLNNQVNPFDKLEANQRDYFENIRVKLGNNYTLAANDLNKISDDLFDKNILVAEYLTSSTVSFWVSISALIFAVIISALQLYQNRSGKFHSIVLSATIAAMKDYYKTKK